MNKLDLIFSTRYFQRLIFWPLMGLILALVLAWIVYDQFLKPVSQQIQQVYSQEQLVNRLVQQVDQLKQEQVVTESYQQDFVMLDQQGFVQPVDRVGWTDRLNQVSQAWLLSGLSVQFEAEKRVNASDVKQLQVSQSIFYRNKLMLNLRLQSDMDYLKLIDWLRQNVSPFFLIEHCDLQLQRTGVDVELTFKPEQGNIMMRCGLQLLRAEPAAFDPLKWR
ncbi:hypothetical protein [Thiomicrospira pelophila]|uniref:hypothetical protein n=1 Tax=Thiomicrospira pelophila TaxID=934 RepID=UPI0004A6D709|nr:hypothetical protein [Thiomicrospira pelophila]